MRLIDECKEEEDRLQVIAGVEDDAVQKQIDNQRQLTHNQLARFEQMSNVLEDADKIEARAKQLAAETFELTQQIEDEDKRAEAELAAYLKRKQAGVAEGFEQFVGKVKQHGDLNKEKVRDLEKEMEEMGRILEQREREINRIRDQFEREETETEAWLDGLDETQRMLLKNSALHMPFESKVRHLLDEETEQEDEDRISKVMADLEEFKQMTERAKAEDESRDARGQNTMARVDLIE